jgi:hypothetical protein
VRRAGASSRRYVELVYVGVALVIAAAFLPSILRPPPEQTNDSAALNPGDPPDDQSDAVIQSFKQAQGSGAGATEGEGKGAATTTTVKPPLAFAQCYGKPARQIESVYAAPCAPRWSGDNGGSTSKNVLPNEVRLSFWHGLAAPTAGRINPEPHAGESAVDRTFRVLERYFNEHYQTYGRHVSFYGGAEGGASPAEQIAEAQKEIDEWKIFGAWHIDRSFCETVARVGPVICNPFEQSEFEKFKPNLYSFMMALDQSNAISAEFVCKYLLNKPAVYSGTGTPKDQPRKFGLVVENTEQSVTQTPESFNKAFGKACGGHVDLTYTVDFNRQETVTTAVQQMRTQGVTTVLMDMLGGTVLEMMSAADGLAWQPEWMVMGNYGLDLNNFASLYPKQQSAHLFGVNTWELPHRFDEWECNVAYKSIDPANTADQETCMLHWHPMVVLMNMIQEAGPKLTPQTVQEGMWRVGRRFYTTPQWAIGGGFGPGDYSYMDDVGIVWYSNTRIDAETGRPGTYVWINQAKRYQLGQLPANATDSLFKRGVSGPGEPDTDGGAG